LNLHPIPGATVETEVGAERDGHWRNNVWYCYASLLKVNLFFSDLLKLRLRKFRQTKLGSTNLMAADLA
jgi:hypothetical protein